MTAEDLIKISGYINQKRYSWVSETPDVSEAVGTATDAVTFGEEQKPQPAEPKKKTLEEIEKEMKDKKADYRCMECHT